MSLLQRLVKFLPLLPVFLLGAVYLSNPSYAESRSVSIPKSNSVIYEQIKAKIAAHPELKDLPIVISVWQGIVRIFGEVPKKAQLKAIIILIDSIAGVQGLDVSGLTLKTGIMPVDDVINSEVIGTFNREGLMGPLSQAPIVTTISGPGNATYLTNPPPINIQVKTQNRIVFLSGTVPDQATADKAEKLAQSIPNVSEVQSTLKVSSSPK